MRIGINLLYLLPGVVGGTQTYAVSLIRALTALDTENEYVLYVNRESADLEIAEGPRIRTVVCPVWAKSRERRYLWEQIVLPWRLRRDRVDLLHSMGYVGPLFPPCAQVVTIHDVNFLAVPNEMSSLRQKTLNKMVPLVARRCARVVTVSEFSKNEIMQRLRVPAEQIVVTLEGPREQSVSSDSDWDEIAARYQIVTPYLIAFSSQSQHKNISRLVQAFANICKLIPHTLLLVGHPMAGHDYDDDFQRLGLTDRVKITGYVPDKDVMPLLKHSDLFVFPSLYEGFGLPILDAQTVGVPVACSRAASLPEVAGEGAALFDPTSIEEMSQVILECLSDAAQRGALVEKGYVNAAGFSWKSVGEKTLACYQEAVGNVK